MVKPCEEKHRGRCTNENLEDGSERTQKDKKAKTEVERCYTKTQVGRQYLQREEAQDMEKVENENSMRRPQIRKRLKKFDLHSMPRFSKSLCCAMW